MQCIPLRQSSATADATTHALTQTVIALFFFCMCSCRFGSRARGLKNTVAVHVRLNAEVLQQQLEKAKAQVGNPATGRRQCTLRSRVFVGVSSWLPACSVHVKLHLART